MSSLPAACSVAAAVAAALLRARPTLGAEVFSALAFTVEVLLVLVAIVSPRSPPPNPRTSPLSNRLRKLANFLALVDEGAGDDAEHAHRRRVALAAERGVLGRDVACEIQRQLR